ncbi:MAG: hypothetical protein Q4E64_02755 [Phascolarctobacterium sp.]|uniref:hypothetical protein n=1 Tax=Phascolarctobacterium sp. TaxID=2049039 RepID=UPI0026DB680A|nr:hypothetical protein [Phascolarctobacterium sp.]MDO4920734.1 hypothetical protein [Phascolarctobacterium sp.]
MRFINSSESASFVQIFAKAFYQGNCNRLKRGEYSAGDFSVVGSVKVADFTRAAFYENADGSGKNFTVDKDCADIKIPFVPKLAVIETYAQGIKGEAVKALPEGEYMAAELKEFDKVIVPRGFYAVFAGNVEDGHAVRIFENEECVVDEKIDGYAKVLLFTLGQDDVRINFGIKEELTDDDLLAVAGGKKCNKCDIHAPGCGKFVARDF